MEYLLLILARIFLSAAVMTNDVKTEENHDSVIIQYGTKAFAGRALKTSPELFRLMNFDLVASDFQGNVSGGVILPERTKLLLFGNAPAVGKMLVVDSVYFKVLGIVKHVPERSCLCSEVIILDNTCKIPLQNIINIRCSIIN